VPGQHRGPGPGGLGRAGEIAGCLQQHETEIGASFVKNPK
jgi:hypothetical protein